MNGRDEVMVEEEPGNPSASAQDVPVQEPGSGNNEQLLAHFRAMLQVTNVDDILQNVLATSLYLDGKGGTVSFARESKSLVARWLTKGADCAPTDGDVPSKNEIIIERDVIVLLNIKTGRGERAATVSLPYRVLNIYEKYYNKWFMSKKPYKKWRKEPKPYKVKVRLLEKNVLHEYNDVVFYGGVYGKDDNCRIVEDSSIIDVIGKLHQVVN